LISSFFKQIRFLKSEHYPEHFTKNKAFEQLVQTYSPQASNLLNEPNDSSHGNKVSDCFPPKSPVDNDTTDTVHLQVKNLANKVPDVIFF